MNRVDKGKKASRAARTERSPIPSRSDLQQQMIELVEQQAAISELLRALANSSHDLQPIFDAIVANARRLCRAHFGVLLLFEDNDFRVVARKGPVEASPHGPFPVEHTLGVRSGTPLARLVKTRSPIHIVNLAADRSYLDRDPGVVRVVESLGARTSLLVPMLKDNELIGAISILRTEVNPFTEKQIMLITDFAAEATIALESTRRERQQRQMQMELAHTNRVATMGQLTASIAHELKQPLTAVMMGGDASLHWLRRQPPEIAEAIESVERMIRDAKRASDVIGRIHRLVKKDPARRDVMDVNHAILEVMSMIRSEAVKNGVTVRSQLADRLPPIRGDRVQLQQVLLNLIVNAIQAMNGLAEGVRELSISTENAESKGIRVAVRDSGPGLGTENIETLFQPFYTTKPNGMGMGLSICRSIIEDHGGRLWATRHESLGALFQFTLPAWPE